MARKRQKVWQESTPPAAPEAREKLVIVGACESFIREVLKPRFLSEIKPTERNYIVDIHGAWAAGRYRFIRRYRSGFPRNRGMEFDISFARVDRMGHDLFDIQWMRHTGTWWPLHSGRALAEALHIVETDPVFCSVW